MNLKDISQLYQLKSEIEMDKQRLARLRAEKTVSLKENAGYSSDDIDEIESIIAQKIARSIRERKRLEQYIAEIPDSLTRQIFTYRFVDGLSWDSCAARIRGGNTAKNLSNICYRYLEKRNGQT